MFLVCSYVNGDFGGPVMIRSGPVYLSNPPGGLTLE